jgi:hypothetical protein
MMPCFSKSRPRRILLQVYEIPGLGTASKIVEFGSIKPSEQCNTRNRDPVAYTSFDGQASPY